MRRKLTATALLLCFVVPGLAGISCNGAANVAPGAAAGGQPAGVEQLPGLPQEGAGAQRVASDYTFQPTDAYELVGGAWDGNTITLQQDGFSYAILFAQAGGQQVDAVSLSGTAAGLWLGIGDYGRGTWHWIAGPLDGGGQHLVPEINAINAAGEMFIALACPDGAGCAMEVSLMITEPGSVVTLGPELAGEMIKPLLGVNAGPYPAGEDPENVDLDAQYEALGVNYVRTHDFYGPLDMAEMYPDRSADPALEGSYEFGESDIRWQAILDCGAQPYFRLGDSYNNSTPPADATERANMALAAVQIVKHFRDGQWNGFNTPFIYLEIWNEPENETFWPGHSQLEFFQFYAETVFKLKEAYPTDLKIGGPGFVAASYYVEQQYVKDFLDYMSTNSVPLDFLSWHIYSNIPVDYANAALWYREQLDTYGFNAAESHLTEYNTSEKDLLPGELVELRTGARGASLLTASWIALQGAPVDQAMFYRGNDTSKDLETFYGLYRAYGGPKKIAHAFAQWHMLCGYPALVQSVATTPGGAASSMWALAGSSGTGWALLVTNPSATASSLSLAFADGSFPEDYSITVREVNATSDGTEVLPSDGIVVPIGAYGVQLIEINAS